MEGGEKLRNNLNAGRQLCSWHSFLVGAPTALTVANFTGRELNPCGRFRAFEKAGGTGQSNLE